MFKNLPLCVIQFPTGRYGFVGGIPLALGTLVPATPSDVMGGRAIRDDAGSLVAPKFPTFETGNEAVEFAKFRGFNAAWAPVASPPVAMEAA